jgi:hypothetical protein
MAESASKKKHPSKNSTATRAAAQSVERFLANVAHPTRRQDAQALDKLFRSISGEKPRLWGSIVGYGTYRYTLANGEQSESLRIGFSPRNQSLVIYIMPGFHDPGMLERLGKHKTGKSCLYITRLDHIDLDVLRELSQAACNEMKRRYPS